MLMSNASFTSSIARSKMEGQFFMLTPSKRGFLGDEEDYCAFGLLATDLLSVDDEPDFAPPNGDEEERYGKGHRRGWLKEKGLGRMRPESSSKTKGGVVERSILVS